MPPKGFAPWRDLLRKAAKSIKDKLQQTESEVAALLAPKRPQSIPIPIPIRLPPKGFRFPGDRRFIHTSFNAAKTQAAPRVTRPIAAAFKTQFTRSCLRPTLHGTLPRTAHGVTLGSGRTFCHSATNHARVAMEVANSISQGLRAGVLNVTRTVPSSRKETQRDGHVLSVLKSVRGHPQTTLSIKLYPEINVLSKGELLQAFVSEIDEAILAVPAHLARIRRDLQRLAKAGSFPYVVCVKDRTLEITFAGKEAEAVERFLIDIGVVSGTLIEGREPFLEGSSGIGTEEVDWRKVFGQKKGKSRHGTDSLERYLEEIDTRVIDPLSVVLDRPILVG